MVRDNSLLLLQVLMIAEMQTQAFRALLTSCS